MLELAILIAAYNNLGIVVGLSLTMISVPVFAVILLRKVY